MGFRQPFMFHDTNLTIVFQQVTCSTLTPVLCYQHEKVHHAVIAFVKINFQNITQTTPKSGFMRCYIPAAKIQWGDGGKGGKGAIRQLEGCKFEPRFA